MPGGIRSSSPSASLRGAATPPWTPLAWVSLDIEVPPAAAVGDEVQEAAGAERGLEDRLLPPPRHQAASPKTGVLRQLSDPQLGAVPRHLRVAPARPGQSAAVGAEAGERVEGAPSDDDAGCFRPVGGEGDDLVDWLPPGDVALPHADDPPAVRGDDSVGVTVAPREQRLRRDGPGRAPRVDAVEALVLEVREEDRGPGHPVAPAPVLVDEGPGVEAPGDHVRRLPAGGPANHHAAAALVGAALEPVEVAVGPGDLAEPHPARGDEVGADGRRPRAVRGDALLDGGAAHLRTPSPSGSWPDGRGSGSCTHPGR